MNNSTSTSDNFPEKTASNIAAEEMLNWGRKNVEEMAARVLCGTFSYKDVPVDQQENVSNMCHEMKSKN